MSSVSKNPGKLPTPPSSPGVATDGVTITGNGSQSDPLRGVPGGTAVAVDGTSITGDGTIDDPLATIPGGTPVVTDGTTITGNGTTGSPLHATGGGGTWPPSSQTEIVYVNKAGNDGTANGSPLLPFLTIQAALNSIVDASAAKPYAVLVGPGIYSDNFDIIPWVGIVGTVAPSVSPNPQPMGATIIDAAAIDFAAGPWAGVTGFSWFSWCYFDQSQTFNQPATAIPAVSFNACTFAAGIGATFNGLGNGESVFFDSCVMWNFASLENTGFQLTTNNCALAGVTLNPSPSGAPGTLWIGNSCTFTNSLELVWTSGNPTQATLLNCATPLGLTLTLNGAGAQFMATVGGVPPSVVLLNGASPPALWSNANTLGYAPTMPGNWSPVPDDVQDALDQLATRGGSVGGLYACTGAENQNGFPIVFADLTPPITPPASYISQVGYFSGSGFVIASTDPGGWSPTQITVGTSVQPQLGDFVTLTLTPK
jgi:hypothetical protein